MSPISGTQSPPLEATGEHTVMGCSSVYSTEQPQVVLDIEQRRQYFEDEPEVQETKKESGNKPAFKAQTVGQTLAEQGREID